MQCTIVPEMVIDADVIKKCIERSLSLKNQPLSGRSLEAIVKAYEDGSSLMESIKRPEAYQDFRTKFIEENEAYVQIEEPERSFLRVCHNLRDSNDYDEVFLFIHGLGGTLEQFEPLMRVLDETGKKFLAVDLPGFGKSDQWDRYDMIDVVGGIHQALLKVTGSSGSHKLSIVGHSMGCYLSIHYFMKYHNINTISRIVLLGPPKPTIDRLAKDRYWTQIGLRTGLNFPWLFDIYRERFDQCRGLNSSGIKQFFYREGDLISTYRKLWQFHNNVQIKSRSIFGYFLGWRKIDWPKLNEMLSDEACRTSVIGMCGDNDSLTPVQCLIDTLELLPDLKAKKSIIIEDCGHNLCFDHPRPVVEKFCESVM